MTFQGCIQDFFLEEGREQSTYTVRIILWYTLIIQPVINDTIVYYCYYRLKISGGGTQAGGGKSKCPPPSVCNPAFTTQLSHAPVGCPRETTQLSHHPYGAPWRHNSTFPCTCTVLQRHNSTFPCTCTVPQRHNSTFPCTCTCTVLEI